MRGGNSLRLLVSLLLGNLASLDMLCSSTAQKAKAVLGRQLRHLKG